MGPSLGFQPQKEPISRTCSMGAGKARRSTSMTRRSPRGAGSHSPPIGSCPGSGQASGFELGIGFCTRHRSKYVCRGWRSRVTTPQYSSLKRPSGAGPAPGAPPGVLSCALAFPPPTFHHSSFHSNSIPPNVPPPLMVLLSTRI